MNEENVKGIFTYLFIFYCYPYIHRSGLIHTQISTHKILIYLLLAAIIIAHPKWKGTRTMEELGFGILWRGSRPYPFESSFPHSQSIPSVDLTFDDCRWAFKFGIEWILNWNGYGPTTHIPFHHYCIIPSVENFSWDLFSHNLHSKEKFYLIFSKSHFSKT